MRALPALLCYSWASQVVILAWPTHNLCRAADPTVALGAAGCACYARRSVNEDLMKQWGQGRPLHNPIMMLHLQGWRKWQPSTHASGRIQIYTVPPVIIGPL